VRASSERYPLSLHDALPISILVELRQRVGRALHERLVPPRLVVEARPVALADVGLVARHLRPRDADAAELDAAVALAVDQPEGRSEEHTSELQSRENLVCRL